MLALHQNMIYRTCTTAQVPAFISAKDDRAKYAWSFGHHTPCGSAAVLPLSALLQVLQTFFAKSEGGTGHLHLEPPPWLHRGIVPETVLADSA